MGVGNDVTNSVCYSDLDTYIAKSIGLFKYVFCSDRIRITQSLTHP